VKEQKAGTPSCWRRFALCWPPQGAPRRPKLDDAVGAGKLGRLRRIYADRRFKPQPLEVELDRLPIRLFTSRKD